MSSGKPCNSSYLTTLRSPDSEFSCYFMRFWILKRLYTCSKDLIAYFPFWGCYWDRFGILSHCTMGQFGDASPSFIGWQMSGSKLVPKNCRLVSSVGRVPVWWARGCGFKPRPDQHSGSLNDWEESAALVMTSTNGWTFYFSRIRTKNCRSRLTALSFIWFLCEVKEPTPLFEKSGGSRRRWCGQPFLGWVDIKAWPNWYRTWYTIS